MKYNFYPVARLQNQVDSVKIKKISYAVGLQFRKWGLIDLG